MTAWLPKSERPSLEERARRREQMRCDDCKAGRHTSPPNGLLCMCMTRTCACYGMTLGRTEEPDGRGA